MAVLQNSGCDDRIFCCGCDDVATGLALRPWAWSLTVPGWHWVFHGETNGANVTRAIHPTLHRCTQPAALL